MSDKKNGGGNGGGHNPPIGFFIPDKEQKERRPPVDPEDLRKRDLPRFWATTEFFVHHLGLKPVDPKKTNGWLMRDSKGNWYNLEEAVRAILKRLMAVEEAAFDYDDEE